MKKNRPFKFLELSSLASDLSILSHFYTTIYELEFPDPDERESLENMSNYLRLKTEGWYRKNNYHILVVIQDEQLVAGSITDAENLGNVALAK
ncbi:MAG: hypothetical protein ABL903_17325 [Methylococcales bacterium]